MLKTMKKEKNDRLRIGYIYILFNKSMPGIVKIGMTTRSVEERVRELYNTSVPDKFEISFSMYVPDCETVERIVHNKLNYIRIDNNREFFKISIEEAINIVRRVSEDNILKYPGWPTPTSAEGYTDRVALNRFILENEKIELERERIKLERERIIKTRSDLLKEEEIKKKNEIEHRKYQDRNTKEILSSGYFGWITIFMCVIWSFSLLPDVGKILLIIAQLSLGVFVRIKDKNNALETRKSLGLPDFFDKKTDFKETIQEEKTTNLKTNHSYSEHYTDKYYIDKVCIECGKTYKFDKFRKENFIEIGKCKECIIETEETKQENVEKFLIFTSSSILFFIVFIVLLFVNINR